MAKGRSCSYSSLLRSRGFLLLSSESFHGFYLCVDIINLNFFAGELAYVHSCYCYLITVFMWGLKFLLCLYLLRVRAWWTGIRRRCGQLGRQILLARGADSYLCNLGSGMSAGCHGVDLHGTTRRAFDTYLERDGSRRRDRAHLEHRPTTKIIVASQPSLQRHM